VDHSTSRKQIELIHKLRDMQNKIERWENLVQTLVSLHSRAMSQSKDDAIQRRIQSHLQLSFPPQTLVAWMHEYFSYHLNLFHGLEKTPMTTRRQRLSILDKLHEDGLDSYELILHDVFSQVNHHQSRDVSSQEIAMEEDESDEEPGQDVPNARMLMDSFHHTCRDMATIGLLEQVEPVIVELLYKAIETHIRRYHKMFERRVLEKSLVWLNDIVLAFLRQLGSEETMQRWKARLEFHLFKSLCDLRISELVDIILEYPENDAALRDLRICMLKTDQKRHLMDSLAAALRKRLLHQGATTSDILEQYISTIKSFNVLDPSRLMLEQIAGPIRKYLRSRDDTVPCIINSLLDSANQSLFDNLEPMMGDKEDWDDMEWKPMPMELDPSTASRSKKSADIVSMLISIYPTRDVFVKEYQKILADKLIASKDYDVSEEFKNLELLKIRFGDGNMQHCEVMIKDMYDSKRIDVFVHHGQPKELHALILSDLFWPEFQDPNEIEGAVTLEMLPKHIRDNLTWYEDRFKLHKQSRHLQWMPHLGSVELEIVLKDRIKTVVVSPLHASILDKFTTSPMWRLEDLASDMNISGAVMKKKLAYWIDEGVLRLEASRRPTPNKTHVIETELVYSVVEEVVKQEHERPVNSRLRKKVRVAEEVVESTAVVHDPIQEMRQFERFILTAIRAPPPVTIRRIQAWVGMNSRAEGVTWDRTPDQLNEFLQVLVQEEKIDFIGGSYRLR
jgi:anaphase-promoting complex subunit 2